MIFIWNEKKKQKIRKTVLNVCVSEWMCTICKDADILFILCCVRILFCVHFILFYFITVYTIFPSSHVYLAYCILKCMKFQNDFINETANCLWKITMYDKQKQWSHNYWYTVLDANANKWDDIWTQLRNQCIHLCQNTQFFFVCVAKIDKHKMMKLTNWIFYYSNI